MSHLREIRRTTSLHECRAWHDGHAPSIGRQKRECWVYCLPRHSTWNRSRHASIAPPSSRAPGQKVYDDASCITMGSLHIAHDASCCAISWHADETDRCFLAACRMTSMRSTATACLSSCANTGASAASGRGAASISRHASPRASAERAGGVGSGLSLSSRSNVRLFPF